MRKKLGSTDNVHATIAHASGAVKPVLTGVPAKIVCAKTDCSEMAMLGDRLCATHRVALNEIKSRERE